MTASERLAAVDQIIAKIKISQDEHMRGGREVIETPEQLEKRKYKQIRLSRTYEDGNN